MLLTNVGVACHYMDMMKKLIEALIYPRLEFAAVVWSQHIKNDTKMTERIQRVATKINPSLAGLTYKERLEKSRLLSLKERRERGNMMALFMQCWE